MALVNRCQDPFCDGAQAQKDFLTSPRSSFETVPSHTSASNSAMATLHVKILGDVGSGRSLHGAEAEAGHRFPAGHRAAIRVGHTCSPLRTPDHRHPRFRRHLQSVSDRRLAARARRVLESHVAPPRCCHALDAHGGLAHIQAAKPAHAREPGGQRTSPHHFADRLRLRFHERARVRPTINTSSSPHFFTRTSRCIGWCLHSPVRSPQP
jgi:hypothetical protein